MARERTPSSPSPARASRAPRRVCLRAGHSARTDSVRLSEARTVNEVASGALVIGERTERQSCVWCERRRCDGGDPPPVLVACERRCAVRRAGALVGGRRRDGRLRVALWIASRVAPRSGRRRLRARDHLRLGACAREPPEVRSSLEVWLHVARVVPGLLHDPQPAAHPRLAGRARPRPGHRARAARARSAALHLLILAALPVEPLVEVVHLVRHVLEPRVGHRGRIAGD